MASNSDGSKYDSSGSKMSSFSLVNFCNVFETYTTGSDVTCCYVISEQLEASSSDWVGLYKVGWRSSKDYYFYMWSQLPSNYVAGKEAECCIVFPGAKMPKDDGEFYQFCYVTSSGHIRGASAPFQFKHLTTDDLIEVEDENGELLVIRTKTAVLEDQLKKASESRAELFQQIRLMENERELLKFSEKDLEQKYLKQKDLTEAAQQQFKETCEKLADLQQETKDLQVHVRSLQEKLEVLNQEKQTMEKRLDENDLYIASLQDKIKTLVTDKDVLSGRVKQLDEEKDLLQTQNAASESQLQRFMTKLRETETNEAALKNELARLETDLAEQHNKCSKLTASSNKEKEDVADLQERLRNAEDKLEAAASCKKMLNEECLTLRQAFEKISNDLEAARSEAESLTSLLQKEKASRQQEVEELNKIHSQQTGENSRQSEIIAELRQQLDVANEKSSPDASAFLALQSALTVLRSRNSELQTKNDDANKKLQQAESLLKQHRARDTEQREEIVGLKTRLKMGTEEYQKIFIDRRRLEDELEKLKKTGQKCLSIGDCEPFSHTKLLQQLAEIQEQLERRREKAMKYKRLYCEQKKKYEAFVATQRTSTASPASVVLSPPSAKDSSSPSRSQKETSPAEQVLPGEVYKDFDPLVISINQTCLSPPLKPLPPPMTPQILPSAKVAAVKAQSGFLAANQMADCMTGVTEPELVTEDDKFVDAESGPLFAMLDSVDYVCPMCEQSFSVASNLEFQRHVNEHFDE